LKANEEEKSQKPEEKLKANGDNKKVTKANDGEKSR
jgi:hypothetical protein